MRGAQPWNLSRVERKRAQELAQLRKDIEVEENKVKQFSSWLENWERAEQMRRFIAIRSYTPVLIGTGGDVILGTMAAADFNGDGKLDVAVVGEYLSSGGVTILLGNGDGTFTAAGPNL